MSENRVRVHSTLFCESKMLNRAFVMKTTSGKLGFHNQKSTRDDVLLTDFGVCFPFSLVPCDVLCDHILARKRPLTSLIDRTILDRRKKILDHQENSRSKKNFSIDKIILDRQKISRSAKTSSIDKKILDRQKKFSIGKKILDRQN